ncbi:SDR family NAD(P)-dependent oxidoreductase [Pectobacterium betavasculorum]|uniref:SDR family NAD(P)-dependent oxidoreductase n=1 Tax=Pectobacterium betavasculorum TaxID=55207 RepID=UPI00313BD7FA
MPTIMVFGAGPGIGFETAHRFAQEGFDLVLASRDPAKLGDQLDALRATGVAVTTEAVDATDGRAVSELVARYADQLDVLVYNAAALRFGPTIDQVAPETFDEDIQVGISSAMRAIQAVLPAMTGRGSGTILLTGGGLADHPSPIGLTLSAAKAGLRATGQALFEPLRAQGVHIATVTVMVPVTPGSEHARQIADIYWQIHSAPADAWDYEHRFTP